MTEPIEQTAARFRDTLGNPSEPIDPDVTAVRDSASKQIDLHRRIGRHLNDQDIDTDPPPPPLNPRLAP